MTTGAEQATDRLQVTIAGIVMDLTWEGARMLEEPSLMFYQGFLSNGQYTDPEVRLHLHCGTLPDVKPETMIFDAVANNLWRLFLANGRSDGRFVYEFFNTMAPHPPVQLAFLTPDFRSGEIYRRLDETYPRHAWSLLRLMRPFGELLLVNLLAQGRGVMVHGLGICDRGEGWLFVGRSGAGKSTLANLYKPHQGVTILGDERLVVTQDGGRFWISGTPWPGEGTSVSAATVPLRRIFFLEHGKTNALISDTPVNLFGLFFQQLFLPFWNGEALAFALGFGEELLRTVPASRLAFVNNQTVIDFLREQG